MSIFVNSSFLALHSKPLWHIAAFYATIRHHVAGLVLFLHQWLTVHVDDNLFVSEILFQSNLIKYTTGILIISNTRGFR